MQQHVRYTTVAATMVGLLLTGCDDRPRFLEPDPGPVGEWLPNAVGASGYGTDLEPNNSCPAAQNIGLVGLPYTLNGSLDPVAPASGDVDFFRFEGTPHAAVRADLEGQATGAGTLGDPFLGFFGSSESGCALFARDDDGGVGLNSRLAFSIPADGVFVLAVTRCCDGNFTDGGVGSYRLSIQEVLPPPNDDFGTATLIENLPFGDQMDLSAATMQVGEPIPSCAVPFGPVQRTSWYRFSPTDSRSISANVFASFAFSVAAYSGSSLAALTEVGCGVFGSPATFQPEAATQYYFQVTGLFGQAGPLNFQLDVTPPPVAGFGFFPFDPSVFDVVQFFSNSFDPGGLGFASEEWDFGDGASATGCCPTHQYSADGDYTVELVVTTVDGRIGSASQTVSVRTRDVAITKFTAPKAASSGQTRQIAVGINSKRGAETVEVHLLKSVPGGFQFLGALTQSVPVRPSNRTTSFDFSYTFTAEDAQVGKVTFKAIANIVGGRDALPADNEAIAPPTKINR